MMQSNPSSQATWNQLTDGRLRARIPDAAWSEVLVRPILELTVHDL
jgi:hypothetical protein